MKLMIMMVYDTWMDWIADVQPMSVGYDSFMDNDKCLNDEDAAWGEIMMKLMVKKHVKEIVGQMMVSV